MGYVNTAQVFQAPTSVKLFFKNAGRVQKDKAAVSRAIQAEAKTKIEKLKRDGELLGPDEIENFVSKLVNWTKYKNQSLL